MQGLVDIYDETTGEVYDIGNLTMIVAYFQDGTPISEDDGGPLRITFIDTDQITASGLWTKYVDSIEIIEE